MLNHASLGVKDLARAGAFYDKLFRPMNIVRAAGTRPDELAYGSIGTPASLYGLVLRDVEGHRIEFVALEGAE